MFDFGKSLLTMTPDEQKNAVAKATPAQRNTALERGIGFNGQFDQKKQQRQQKRDRFHDLDRLNFTVEKENEAHEFFGKSLGDWQKGVTGNNPSKDAGTLKKQFDDYEQNLLSGLPKDGKHHTALSKSLPSIKDGFLKQGHQFAMDKLKERSRDVLSKGLKRIAGNALGAKGDVEFQLHDDQAAELINQYVLSEASFDEKDADSFYDQFLKDAGVTSEKELVEQKPEALGVAEKASMQNAEPMIVSEPKGEVEPYQQEAPPAPEEDKQAPGKSSAKHAREMESKEQKGSSRGKLAGADNDTYRKKLAGADRKKEWTSTQTVAEAKRHVGSEAWRKDRERGEFDDDSYKCNLFVSEMLERSGAKVPMIGGMFGGNPPLASQWADKDQEVDGYVVVDTPKPGDVASDGGHVGIVSVPGKTVSASSDAHKVVENDWGFRPQQKGTMTFRRYVGAGARQ